MAERHFKNKAATSAKASSAAGGSTNPEQQQQTQLDSDTCTKVARQLMKKCLDHYEGPTATAATTEKASNSASSSSPKKSTATAAMGTLYYGGLGARVYLRLRMAQHLKAVADKQPAAKKTRSSLRHPSDGEIQSLLQKALQLAEEAVEIESERMERHSIRVTLLEGPYVGAKALVAALYHHLGQEPRSREEGNELLEFLEEHTNTNSLSTRECEVLYGRAGALQAILFLRQEFEEDEFGSEEAVTLAQAIVDQGLKTAAANQDCKDFSKLPLLWEWHGKKYLGAAHGVVGILHTLLCLKPSELEQLTVKDEKKKEGIVSLIQGSIRGLDSYCWPESGNLRSSIESSSSHDKLVHWCHGAPGYVLLLVKAYEVFGDTSFLEKARDIGTKVIWPRGLLRKGVGLCHGISGNAYCLLALGRPHIRNKDEGGENGMDEGKSDASGNGQNDPLVWMKQACYFAAFSLEKWSALESVPDHPFSVFEGAGALALLMMDLGTLHHKNSKSDGSSTIKDARFPLYDF